MVALCLLCCVDFIDFCKLAKVENSVVVTALMFMHTSPNFHIELHMYKLINLYYCHATTNVLGSFAPLHELMYVKDCYSHIL